MTDDPVWQKLYREAEETAAREPALRSLLSNEVLNSDSLEEALSIHLAYKLSTSAIPFDVLKDLCSEAFSTDDTIGQQVRRDITATVERDPACDQYLTPFLYFKGFQALTGYRIAHALWEQKRKNLAWYLQSLIAEIFAVDIHPAACIGSGILLDHATSVVIGETAVVDDTVSILHEVTLGGTGKEHGDRHPKIRSGVLIGVGAKILGNIEVGEGAKVGAGSLVLNDVPPHMTVIGVPAKVVCRARETNPACDMKHNLTPNTD